VIRITGISDAARAARGAALDAVPQLLNAAMGRDLEAIRVAHGALLDAIYALGDLAEPDWYDAATGRVVRAGAAAPAPTADEPEDDPRYCSDGGPNGSGDGSDWRAETTASLQRNA